MEAARRYGSHELISQCEGTYLTKLTFLSLAGEFHSVDMSLRDYVLILGRVQKR